MKKYIIAGIIIIIVIIISSFVFDWWRKDAIVSDNIKGDLIVITKPAPLSVIKSPISVLGKARGFWYFEGSFPVLVEDEDGNIFGQGIAQADGEWMTEDFVNFSGKIEFFVATGTTYGKLVFKKDNPSGMLENEDGLEIPIRF